MNKKLTYELAENYFYKFGELLEEYDVDDSFEDLIFYIEKYIFLAIAPNSDDREKKLYIRAFRYLTTTHKQILTEQFGEDFASQYMEASKHYFLAKIKYERTLSH